MYAAAMAFRFFDEDARPSGGEPPAAGRTDSQATFLVRGRRQLASHNLDGKVAAMPASKIQDEAEVLRWFEQGRPYDWMVAEYQRKYNIETTATMWGNFRQRRGLPRRISRVPELIPWGVRPEHRQSYLLSMLRLEGRRREGLPMRESAAERNRSWLSMLEERQMVVHYDPNTSDGFSYVPREFGDDDLIRRPPVATRVRRTLD